MDDDDFGADADFLAALAATDVGLSAGGGRGKGGSAAPAPAQPSAPGRPPAPAARIQQPVPQRVERPGGGGGGSSGSGTPGPAQRIVQPTPQALPGGVATKATTKVTAPSSGSTILVSPRQRGNPVLAQLRTVPWEYSDIVADYGLGATTGALFLSLKYHRLHPEYIFARFRGLRGGYRLRVLLALVDIDNHEEVLRELAKTALVNQLTLVLCWSAAEAARYLELYKTYEHATSFAAIRGGGGSGGSGSGSLYAEHLVRFATVPRVIHKADAVALVGTFGSLRRAVQAEPEQLALVTGWGERKIQAWRRAVNAPFRAHKSAAARRAAKNNQKTKGGAGGGADGDGRTDDALLSSGGLDLLDKAIPLGRVPARDMPGVAGVAAAVDVAGATAAITLPVAVVAAAAASDTVASPQASEVNRPEVEQLSDGVAAALARLRERE